MPIPYSPTFPHDSIDGLLAFHRSVFGTARMENVDAGGDPGEPDGDAPAAQSGDEDKLGDAGKRALEQERRAAKAEKRRADEAERQLEEMRRQQMTDQERVAAERDDWRKKYEEQAAELAARDLDILRRDVAAEKGLNPALARRLQGVTREELETDADELKTLAASSTPPVPPTPRPDPSQGSGHESKGGRPTTVADAMREAREARARRSGSTT